MIHQADWTGILWKDWGDVGRCFQTTNEPNHGSVGSWQRPPSFGRTKFGPFVAEACVTGICNQGDWWVNKQSKCRSPLIYSQNEHKCMLIQTILSPRLLIGIRKTRFREFSGGAASLFNLRQQRSDLSSLWAAGGSLCEGNSIDWANSSFLPTRFYSFFSRAINRGREF